MAGADAEEMALQRENGVDMPIFGYSKDAAAPRLRTEFPESWAWIEQVANKYEERENRQKEKKIF